MKKGKKTRGQLISELAKLRQRIVELEKIEAEHKLTEQTLRESKELFEKTFVSQLAALFILDANNPPKILDCNPSTTTVFGHSRKEMLGRTTDFLHVDKRRRRKFQENLYPKIAKQGFFHLPEFEMKRKDGTVFPTEHTVVSLEDEQDKRIGWVSVVRDISERKRVEEALRLTQFAIDYCSDAAFWMGHDAQFIYVNDAACSALGYSREELLTMTVHDIDPGFPPEVWAKHWGTLKRRGSFVVESHHRTKGGGTFPVEISVNYVNFGGKEYNCAFARDITERKRAEEALRKRESELMVQSQNLEEVNAALRVLLKRREEDKEELGENVVSNISQLVFPYLEKLKKSRLGTRQTTLVDILESNIKEIASPFVTKLSSKFLNLTPAEIKVAGLIRDGRTTKEIAAVLRLSENTIVSHRYNIRRKLRLKNKKVNLRSYLKSLHQ